MVSYTEELDVTAFQKENRVSVGRLSSEMITFIHSHDPYIGAMLSSDTDIILWKERIAHIARHEKDFFSRQLYDNCLRDLPQIIHAPDYISIREKDRSVSFIKQYSQSVSVVVRVETQGKMSVRTMYPLMSAQLEGYIHKGTAWKYEEK